MTVKLDIAPPSTRNDARDLAAFLEYARPEVARIDSEAATFLTLAIIRLRSIADADVASDSLKH